MVTLNYCPKCGGKTLPSEVFCVSCGNKLPTDQNLRFVKDKKSFKRLILPAFAIIVILIITFINVTIIDNNRTEALMYYEEASQFFLDNDFHESTVAIDKALESYPAFEDAQVFKDFLNVIAPLYRESFDQLSFEDKISQLNSKIHELGDYQGEAAEHAVLTINDQKYHYQVSVLERKLDQNLSIYELQSIIWELEGIPLQESHHLNQEAKERLSSHINTRVTTYLQKNQFTEARILVENALMYLPDDTRLSSLENMIELEYNLFIDTLEERIEGAFLDYQEELTFNEDYAIEVTEIDLRETRAGDLQVYGEVINQATVPVSFIQIHYLLKDSEASIIDEQEVFIFPEALYPGEVGKFDYTYLDGHQLSQDMSVTIEAITWSINH